MTYTYKNLLATSELNRQALGLTEISFVTQKKFITAKVRRKIEKKLLELYYFKNVIQLKLPLSIEQNVRILPWVLKEIDPQAQLTMGSIKKKKDTMYVFDLKDTQRWYHKGLDNNEKSDPNFHVWITLSSMEVLDVTLPIQIHNVLNLSLNPVPFIADKPEKALYNTYYYPFIIGNDLVSQIYRNSLLN